MATVQLADVYNPLVFSQDTQEASIELNAFLNSGVMVTDPRLTSMASSGGNIGDLPYYKPLGMEEPNYSTDAPGNNSTPKKITDGLMKWRLASSNQSWAAMDLARELALQDPVGAITNSIGQYWATQLERRVIQSGVGILADNIANDFGDMRISIATDSSGAITAGERLSGDVIIDARQTAGDHQGGFSVIAMHSVVYSNLQKQELISFVRDAGNNTQFATYNGMRVVVDDSMPAVAGANRVTYTSMLFGAGVFTHGQGAVQTPSEIDRDPSSGNGGGQSVIYSRRADIIHPLGFSFESGSVAGQSATLAELANAGNWSREWDRKNIPIAFVQTNG